MILLEPRNLHWHKNIKDERIDLCAHGNVVFAIDDEVLVSEADGDWTVSAAAVHLLRTLEKDHSREKPSFEHVFPCCGFWMYDDSISKDVTILGCPNGIDFEIIHEDENINILFESHGMFTIPQKDWKNAVLHFSQTVFDFYAGSEPKTPSNEEEKRGFEKFMSEWQRRHNGAKKP